MKKTTKKQPNITSVPFLGKVELKDGKRKLKLNSPIHFQAQLEKFTLGRTITLWLDSKLPKRSVQQNRFYFLYLRMIADETGNEVEDLHTYFKGKYLSRGITEIFSHKVRRVRSTTDLNKSEFSEYLQRIELESGVAIPSTEEFNPSHYSGW